MEPILDVRDLKAHIDTPGGVLRAVDGVNFNIKPGEIVGLVGESGSGKSMTALSLMRLQPQIAKLSGSIKFDGQELLSLSPGDMGRLRGSEISMIFQDPLSYLNPVMRVGPQIAEVVRIHEKVSAAEARERTISVLQSVGIPSPERVFDAYPHELSGGMRQRALISMAIIAKPKLLIADEPTTALDVTVQAQIMVLLTELCRKLGTALILITHDLGVIAEYCDRAYVMYAGRIFEGAQVTQLFDAPLHPYSRGLIRSILPVDRRVERFETIEGYVPVLVNAPPGCLFRPRCPDAMERCGQAVPRLQPRGAEGQDVACWLYEETIS
jgi:oligopeptide/dipeptide ABC transporter ATP-binding protein